MAMSISGCGSSSISTLIAQLETITPKALGEMGLTPAALECLIKLLERIDGIISDGIQPDEIDEIKDLADAVQAVSRIPIPVIDQLKDSVKEIEKLIEEVERIAPGLMGEISNRMSASSGQGTSGSQGVHQLSETFNQILIEEIEQVENESDATEEHSDKQLEMIRQRLNLQSRAEGNNPHQNLKELNRILRNKIGVSNLSQSSGLSLGSHKASQFRPAESRSLSGQLRSAHIQDLGLGNVKKPRDEAKLDRQMIDQIKEREQEVVNRIKELEEKLEEITYLGVEGVFASISDFTTRAIESKISSTEEHVSQILGGLDGESSV
jgi:archaellum component FlaC